MLALRLSNTSSQSLSDFIPAIFRNVSLNSTSVSEWPNFFIHYNNDYATSTYAMQFDDSAEMTYAGGDFKDLGSPTPKVFDFYPNLLAGTASSVRMLDSEFPRFNTHPMYFSICDTGPSITYIEVDRLQGSMPRAMATSGEIVNPVDPSDNGARSRSGAFGCRVLYSLGGLTSSSNGHLSTPRWARFFNSNDTVNNDAAFTFTGDKTILNDRASGVFTGRPLPLTNPKGILDPKFFLEAGALNDLRTFNVPFKTADDETLIKLNGCYTIPWEPGLSWWDLFPKP